MLKGQGLLARSLVVFLRLADRDAAIDGQGFKNHVKPLEIDANIKLLKDNLDNFAERMKKAVHMSALLFVGVLCGDGVSPICVDGDRYNPEL